MPNRSGSSLAFAVAFLCVGASSADAKRSAKLERSVSESGRSKRTVVGRNAAAAAPSPEREALRTMLSELGALPSKADFERAAPQPAALLNGIARDPAEHAYVRERAIAALGSFDSQAVAADLALALTDRSPLVRRAAASVLGRHFGQALPDHVFSALTPLLRDPDTGVRKHVVRALTHVPRREVITVLSQALVKERDPALRELMFHRAVQLEAALKSPSVAVR